MTGAEFKAARERLGLTAEALARVMGYHGPGKVYDIEAGRRGIGEAAARLVRAYLHGYRPHDWPATAEQPLQRDPAQSATS